MPNSPREEDTPPAPPQGNVPVPDPTTLTTEALRRDLHALRELIEARLNANDKATELLEANRQLRVGAALESAEREVAHLRALVDEKFISIQMQFAERDKRLAESALSASTAVSAALQAQKESAEAQARAFAVAIDKSEAATTKQIDALTSANRISKDDVDKRIGELRESITRIESVGIGRSSQVADVRAVAQDTRSNLSLAIGAFALAIPIAAAIVTR